MNIAIHAPHLYGMGSSTATLWTHVDKHGSIFYAGRMVYATVLL